MLQFALAVGLLWDTSCLIYSPLSQMHRTHQSFLFQKLMYAAANAIISLEGNIACWRKWQYTNSIVNNSAGKTQQHSVSTRLCYSAKHSRNKVLPNQKLIKMRADLCNMNPCRREQTVRVLSACLEKRRGRAQEIDPLKWKRVGKIKLLTNSTVIYPPALGQK